MDFATQTESPKGIFGDLKIKSGLLDEETERGEKFWYRAHTELKFKVESEWLKSLLSLLDKERPMYGMGNMDRKHEEIVGLKIELVGPLIDTYLKEIATSIYHKLSRSKATGLMAPVKLFLPWAIYRHILVLSTGYGGDFKADQKRQLLTVSFSSHQGLSKVFSPARFAGENFLKHRFFKKSVDKSKKAVMEYKGRAAVVVSKNTPFVMKFKMNDNRLECQFYVQRYSAEDFAVDASLQTLLNLGFEADEHKE